MLYRLSAHEVALKESALQEIEEALEICRRLDAPWLFATSALNLGTAAMHSGDLERAPREGTKQPGFRFAEMEPRRPILRPQHHDLTVMMGSDVFSRGSVVNIAKAGG